MDEEDNIEGFLSRYKIPLLLSLVGAVLIIGGLISSGILYKTFFKQTITQANFRSEQTKAIKVDISGAVTSPGVYTLTDQSRMEDAIKAAGGLSQDVDQEYISKSINLAQKITDGMKVYIPSIGEEQSLQTSGMALNPQNSLININSASLSDLDGLPGVGQVTAQKIVDSRPYSDINDLMIKKVLSKSVFDKVKDKITLN